MLLFASVLSVAIAEEAVETEVSDMLVSEMAPTAEIIAKPTPRQTLNRSMCSLNTWALTNIAKRTTILNSKGGKTRLHCKVVSL